MPSNNWGPWFPASTFSYPPTGVPTAPAPAPQSPSGSVTNEAAPYNFNNSVTSTQEYLENVLAPESVQQGAAALSNPTVYAGNVGTSSYVNFAAGFVPAWSGPGSRYGQSSGATG